MQQGSELDLRSLHLWVLQVSLVLTWGINNGHVWDCTAAGPAGLTALHLAALLDDGGRIADELTGLS